MISVTISRDEENSGIGIEFAGGKFGINACFWAFRFAIDVEYVSRQARDTKKV